MTLLQLLKTIHVPTIPDWTDKLEKLESGGSFLPFSSLQNPSPGLAIHPKEKPKGSNSSDDTVPSIVLFRLKAANKHKPGDDLYFGNKEILDAGRSPEELKKIYEGMLIKLD